MDKEKTVRELEQSVRANRLTLDRLNRAYYGMTFDELVKLTGTRHDNRREDTEAAN